jgi:hypothetical protein
MIMSHRFLSSLCLFLWTMAGAVWTGAAADSDAPIAQVKTANGTVSVTRGGISRAIGTGDQLFQSDIVTTGADSSVGMTFADNSMMSLGADSKLSLEHFHFDTTTHEGSFESSLQKGTLAVKSGQIVQQSPEAMKVRTPAAILGVRGTTFAVRADGSNN